MKQTSLKSIARHTAAVRSGRIEKTNIIGIRKAINAMERNAWNPPEMIDAQFELEQAIAECHPTVTGELHESGLKVLRNSRYKKRLADVADIIADIDCFRLSHFDWIGQIHCVPVYRAIDSAGRSFAFRNIPWQTAFYSGGESGPVIFGVKR